MTVMSGNLYRALREAKVPDDMAQKAAEEVASYDSRFNKVETDLAIIKWMVGVQFAGVIALVMKAFF
jgi:hypothetical protein